MNTETIATISMVLRLLAIGFAVAAAAKVFGLVSMRPSATELAAIAIALALAK